MALWAVSEGGVGGVGGEGGGGGGGGVGGVGGVGAGGGAGMHWRPLNTITTKKLQANGAMGGE